MPEILKPWGFMHEILPRLTADSWNLIACTSTEDRSYSVAENLINMNMLRKVDLIEISCHESNPEKDTFNGKLEKRRHVAESIFTNHEYSTETFELLSRVGDIYKWYSSLSESYEKLILDISCLPKRFFFPLVKKICSDDSITDFVVCYTDPEKYGKQPLSSNHEPCRVLPAFNDNSTSNDHYDSVLIGVGYSAMNFPEYLAEKSRAGQINLLLPFPPGPPSYKNNWQFVKDINDAFPREADLEPIRVSSRNVPSIFNKICKLTNRGNMKTWLAPYGPKPMSLAMCLYAILCDNCAVYYTQPKVYSPNYSLGVRRTQEGVNEVFSYVIKLGGQKIYSV